MPRQADSCCPVRAPFAAQRLPAAPERSGHFPPNYLVHEELARILFFLTGDTRARNRKGAGAGAGVRAPPILPGGEALGVRADIAKRAGVAGRDERCALPFRTPASPNPLLSAAMSIGKAATNPVPMLACHRRYPQGPPVPERKGRPRRSSDSGVHPSITRAATVRPCGTGGLTGDGGARLPARSRQGRDPQ